MDRFEEIAIPEKVHKTLLYGGDADQKRTKYDVVSWKNAMEW